MAKLFVLEANNDGMTRLAIHIGVPAGNNSAGSSWSSVLVAAGLNTTVLATGSGPSELTAQEAADIAAGTVFESIIEVLAESGGSSGAQLAATVDAAAAAEEARVLTDIQQRYKWYGTERGTI